MKKIQKIFLSGIIFFLILFLQIIFSEKNYAEKTITKDYNKWLCENDIFSEMKKITQESRWAYYKNIDKIWISLREKSEIISYNFRVLSCNLESICSNLQNFMFYWEDWTKENKTDSKWVVFVTWFCPEIKFKLEVFQHCETREAPDFQEIIQYCEWKKDEILYWEDWDWWEYNFLEENFSNDVKKDKVNFLSARIYDLNKKMRDLADNMNRLKVEIVNIINRIICTETW